MKLRIGISSCPNDTFAFSGLLADRVDRRGLDLTIELLDIQELNERLLAGQLDVGKASFHAALKLAERYLVLPVGSAVGFGVGPLVLAGPHQRGDRLMAPARILAPGRDTTATLLLRCLHPEATQVEHCHFAAIMPALEEGRADFGVVIHEGRFTYEAQGLRRVADLGEQWETQTSSPVPLGGLLARRDLPAATLQTLTEVIRASLRGALAHREQTLPILKRHAQELAESVLWSHVDLYVNEQTMDLGPSGRAALEALDRQARKAGVLAPDHPPLLVLE